ncbi:MAG: peptide deformylase [Vicinamibacteria bacterium]|nr:peptide deformylase [Vicinamibacteria bacterium]
MAIRSIVTYGHPALHSPAAPVADIDDGVRELIRDMVDTMYATSGIGLAAPQVGEPWRVIVIDLSLGEDAAQLIRMVNPEIVEQQGEQRHEEGCLSVPGYSGLPVRPARMRVRGLNPDGREQVVTATDLLARAFSHEIDHIEGRLFVDRLSPLKRDLLKRKLRRRIRQDDWER